MKENMYFICENNIYNSITLLCSRNKHNIANQLYFKKFKNELNKM